LADEDEAVAGLWAMAQLGTPMAVRVAATLRIADHIATGPRTATELAGPVGADPDALERLLRYLAVRGLFSRDEAGRYAQGRLSGASVRLVFDADLRDRYGRLLAYVYLGDELFNLTLVQQGYARADPVPPDTRMASVFAGAEAQAKLADRGLWSACPSG